jgi:hypothetical protein
MVEKGEEIEAQFIGDGLEERPQLLEAAASGCVAREPIHEALHVFLLPIVRACLSWGNPHP